MCRVETTTLITEYYLIETNIQIAVEFLQPYHKNKKFKACHES